MTEVVLQAYIMCVELIKRQNRLSNTHLSCKYASNSSRHVYSTEACYPGINIAIWVMYRSSVMWHFNCLLYAGVSTLWHRFIKWICLAFFANHYSAVIENILICYKKCYIMYYLLILGDIWPCSIMRIYFHLSQLHVKVIF